MEIRQMNNILAVKTKQGRLLGFHAQNLQVAQLTPETWEAFTPTPHPRAMTESPPALQALRSWNESLPQYGPQVSPTHKIVINVTQVCNLHCTYCAAGGDGTYGDPVKKISVEQTVPQIFSFIDRVPVGGEFQINFIGGEPLLFPQGLRLLAEAAREHALTRNVKIQFRIVTNGTLLTPANLDILKDLNAHITVSLDGPAIVNDRQRPGLQGNGMTEKVIAGLRSLLERKNDFSSIGIFSVFTKASGAIDGDSFHAFYRQFDIDWYELAFDFSAHSEDLNAKYLTTVERIAELAFNEGGEKELRKFSTFDKFFSTLDNQVPVMNFCQAGKTTFAIDARNQVSTCPWLAGRPKEVVGHGPKLWTEKLEPYEEPLVTKNGCGNCWARYLCGGGCMFIHETHTGEKHRVDELFCKRTRQLASLALSYYELCRSGALA